jgi:hypothetical protein
MEFIVFFAAITLIALGTQLACYAAYRRKPSFAISSISHGMAAEPS